MSCFSSKKQKSQSPSLSILDTISDDQEMKVKIGIVGESSVGKSCCLVRWVDDDFFEEDDKHTIGVDFKVKNVIIASKKFKMVIFDTAGQERFRTVTSTFYRKTLGLLLVFDITNEESFERVENWLQEIRRYTEDGTPVILVGNKCDLEVKRAISTNDAKKWADKVGVPYIETSAKQNINIDKAFMTLMDLIYTRLSKTKVPNLRTP